MTGAGMQRRESLSDSSENGENPLMRLVDAAASLYDTCPTKKSAIKGSLTPKDTTKASVGSENTSPRSSMHIDETEEKDNEHISVVSVATATKADEAPSSSSKSEDRSKSPASETVDHDATVIIGTKEDLVRRTEKKSSFAEYLMSVLEDETNHDIISWMPDGVSFTIVNHRKFTMDLMPKLFKIRNMSSFVRKLTRWGFHRVHEKETGNSDIFKHEYFVRGKPELAKKIRCLNRVNEAAAAASNADEEGRKQPKEQQRKGRSSSGFGAPLTTAQLHRQQSGTDENGLHPPNVSAQQNLQRKHSTMAMDVVNRLPDDGQFPSRNSTGGPVEEQFFAGSGQLTHQRHMMARQQHELRRQVMARQEEDLLRQQLHLGGVTQPQDFNRVSPEYHKDMLAGRKVGGGGGRLDLGVGNRYPQDRPPQQDYPYYEEQPVLTPQEILRQQQHLQEQQRRLLQQQRALELAQMQNRQHLERFSNRDEAVMVDFSGRADMDESDLLNLSTRSGTSLLDLSLRSARDMLASSGRGHLMSRHRFGQGSELPEAQPIVGNMASRLLQPGIDALRRGEDGASRSPSDASLTSKHDGFLSNRESMMRAMLQRQQEDHRLHHDRQHQQLMSQSLRDSMPFGYERGLGDQRQLLGKSRNHVNYTGSPPAMGAGLRGRISPPQAPTNSFRVV